MTVLEIDMGNTRAKWRLRQGPRVLARGVDAVTEFPGSRLMTELRSAGSSLQAIWLAAVCGEDLCQRAVDGLQRATGITARRASPVAVSGNGVRCAYAEPGRLGVDRWLAMLAAHDRRDPEAAGTLVVSCGTAVTLDFVRADGAHEGGYIVPGLFMMREALLSGTGRIRFEAGDFSLRREPGRDTASAVQNGITQAILSLLESARHEAGQRWQGRVELWLTGGDGSKVQAAMAAPCHYVEDLVLDGLCRVGWEQ